MYFITERKVYTLNIYDELTESGYYMVVPKWSVASKRDIVNDVLKSHGSVKFVFMGSEEVIVHKNYYIGPLSMPVEYKEIS